MAAELIRSGSFSDKRWDIFLSFRGEDTRRTFTSHLFRFLKEKGVNVFMDDGLQRGEDISSQLFDVIRRSRISVVVFSRNYADSKWCLQELCEIIECRKKSPGQVVLPVFYDVSPSYVRNQMGLFGKAFANCERHEDVAQWRAALKEAGSLSGWDVTNAANGTEAEILWEVASGICDELTSRTYLDVAKYPVGLERHVKEVKKHMDDGPDDVRFIVICGMRGVGKTTLAKEVYNQHFRTFKDKSLLANVGEDSEWNTFEAKSFLENVGETSKQPNGLVILQEQLLRDVLNDQKMKVGNIARGSNVIKERLRNRKVLFILDDVTHRSQLNVLAREHEWFCRGSRIIITTTDLDSVEVIKPSYVHMLKGLNHAESLQLFCMHAFESCNPETRFSDLSAEVVNYCNGLPLALEVLGSHLRGRSVEKWIDALCELRIIPSNDIQKRLKVSYDGLEGDNEKELFLDIACFFVGWNKDYALKILNGCGFHVEIGLDILIRRNLVRIRGNRLEMHGLIRDMGREIVRKESRNTGERSRLFFRDDILTTLRSHLGTEKVEGLALCSSELTDEKVDAKAFSKMKRLRLLQLNNLHVDGDYGFISKELRWLCWHRFHLNFVPDEFFMENLVTIDMQYSNLRAAWKTSKSLKNLKSLNLSHSHFLSKTPNFSNLPNLEELIMEDCGELKAVDGSIGDLQRVVHVNLRDCKKLRGIPDSICRVKSLRILDISGCLRIKHLPDDFGELTSLIEFLADGAPITKLPLSMANLKNLEKLHLGCYIGLRSRSIAARVWSWISKKEAPKDNNQLNSPLSGLRALTDLRLIGCNLSEDGILQGIGTLGSLEYLNLRGSSFSRLPGSVSSLSNLKMVSVPGCPLLESIPDMPPSVTLVDCRNCPRLTEIAYSERWNPDAGLFLDGSKNLSAECIETIIKSWPPVAHRSNSRGGLLYISVSKIPECFEYWSGGSSLTLQFRPCEVNKLVLSLALSRPVHLRPGYLSLLPSVSLAAPTLRQRRWLYRAPPAAAVAGEVLIGVFSVVPSVIMGDIQYGGTEVELELEPQVGHHPNWVIHGFGIHLEEKKRPSCQLVELDDAKPGPSHGGSSGEFLLEDEPATDLSFTTHRWTLRVVPFEEEMEQYWYKMFKM